MEGKVIWIRGEVADGHPSTPWEIGVRQEACAPKGIDAIS